MDERYDIEAYDYYLPQEKIAQKPSGNRDASKLLVLDCTNDRLIDKRFDELVGLIRPGDILVVNDTRVFPARLLGRKETGGRVEALLLHYPETSADNDKKDSDGKCWQEVSVAALLKSSKRPRPGMKLIFSHDLEAVVEENRADGKSHLLLRYKGSLDHALAEYGSVPLPPYIERGNGEQPWDRERYQTVFARRAGAVAAPTAGLHFTEELLEKIRDRNIGIVSITLHVGYGTFAPVRVQDIRKHEIHAEFLTVSQNVSRQINDTKKKGGKIWAVGTTTVRALEFAADETGNVQALEDWCDLYIYPGYTFKVVDNLITNFHLPRSSLLFLVSALAGEERIKKAYQHAVNRDYRFYSYGDAMVIVR